MQQGKKIADNKELFTAYILSTFKAKIQDKEGIPPDQQHLIAGKPTLADLKSIVKAGCRTRKAFLQISNA